MLVWAWAFASVVLTHSSVSNLFQMCVLCPSVLVLESVWKIVCKQDYLPEQTFSFRAAILVSGPFHDTSAGMGNFVASVFVVFSVMSVCFVPLGPTLALLWPCCGQLWILCSEPPRHHFHSWSPQQGFTATHTKQSSTTSGHLKQRRAYQGPDRAQYRPKGSHVIYDSDCGCF